MKTLAENMSGADPLLSYVKTMVRRVTVTLSSARAVWQVAGTQMPDGRETMKPENFAGSIGVAARPPGQCEAIVIMVGDASAPVMIAAVDRKTRNAIAGALKPDETMLHNSKALLYLKDDGTIEARSANGTAVPLATKADIDAVIEKLNEQIVAHNTHAHTGVTTGGGTSLVATVLVPVPAAPAVGTMTLKGE